MWINPRSREWLTNVHYTNSLVRSEDSVIVWCVWTEEMVISARFRFLSIVEKIIRSREFSVQCCSSRSPFWCWGDVSSISFTLKQPKSAVRRGRLGYYEAFQSHAPLNHSKMVLMKVPSSMKSMKKHFYLSRFVYIFYSRCLSWAC